MDLVKHLNELKKVDLNHGHDMDDVDGIHLKGVGNHIQRTFFELAACITMLSATD
jgi:hypothetical protein